MGLCPSIYVQGEEVRCWSDRVQVIPPRVHAPESMAPARTGPCPTLTLAQWATGRGRCVGGATHAGATGRGGGLGGRARHGPERGARGPAGGQDPRVLAGGRGPAALRAERGRRDGLLPLLRDGSL